MNKDKTGEYPVAKFKWSIIRISAKFYIPFLCILSHL